MTCFNSNKAYKAKENTCLDPVRISTLLSELNVSAADKYNLKYAWINMGGWQSWNPCEELEPNTKQPSLKCHLLKQWNQYILFPESRHEISKTVVLGQFVSYLRWENFYLVFTSVGNIDGVLPPVQFVFDRHNNTVTYELADKGKEWQEGELQAKIEVFTAESYFEAREKLEKLFGSCDKENPNYTSRFDSIQFLGKQPAGWESWYNHYFNINHNLIEDDLKALKETQNLINLGGFDKQNLVFQIDDGWESALGEWTIRKDRFPEGLKVLAEKIEAENYVPGLWLAPFIIDLRSETAKDHPDWILRNRIKVPVMAGYNPLWGANFGRYQPGLPGSFYCLDLSNDAVIEYLDGLMDKVINEWGFRYIKLDFLYAGMLYGKFRNGGSAYQWFNRAVKTLTKRTKTNDGKPVCYLGCGVPFEPAFNYFPLSRTGCDTFEHWENSLLKKLNWNGRNSAYLNVKDSIGRAMWNKIIFNNDPDVIFIRKENCSLTTKEKELIATVAVMFGNQIMYSDDPAKSTSKEEIDIAKKIVEINEKYKNEDFSVKAIRDNIYYVVSKNKKYQGIIDLEERYADIR